MKVIDQLRKAYPDLMWSYYPAFAYWQATADIYVYGESHNYDEGRGVHDIHYVLVNRQTGERIEDVVPPRFNARCG